MPIYTLILAICFSVNAFAGDGHDHEHRHHDAHEHGVGEFNLATDGQKLIIEIELPAHDVVGFEHEARTKEQKSAVNAAVEKLKIAGQNVSIPSRANCKADAAAKVESGLKKMTKVMSTMLMATMMMGTMIMTTKVTTMRIMLRVRVTLSSVSNTVTSALTSTS